MKKVFIVTLMLSAFALTACDNAEQKRRVECTKARDDTQDAFLYMKVDKSIGIAAQKKLKELNCKRSDMLNN